MNKRLAIFLFSFLVLVLFSCKPKKSLDDLALKMSKSQNFIAMVKISFKLKEKADSLKNLPQLKNLSAREKNDSIFKIFSSSSDFKATALKIANQNRIVDGEFPELKKLSKEEKQKVFIKAGALYVANQPLH
jgi:hypothetical protein